MFFRIHTDGLRVPVDLTGHFAGPVTTSCWLIGGGPSLTAAPCDRIQLSPVPKYAVNLCGYGRIRPDLWTAYDPTVRFHRTTYLDASILKLLPARRATDVVPGTTFKVGDCPNTVFFERDGQRGFHDFPGCPATGVSDARIVDWQDSLVQAIDLAWRLGFRRLLLVGCDMHVCPPEEHIRTAELAGVRYQPDELLRNFYDRCRSAGIEPDKLAAAEAIKPYHFDETKSLAAAMQTDFHYFRVAQYLRLSRRAMALAGLQLVSATPNSRLNAFFPYRPIDDLLDEIVDEIGDPGQEITRSQYGRRVDSVNEPGCGMKDFRPHNWASASRSTPRSRRADPAAGSDERLKARCDRLQAALDELPEVEVPLEEAG